MPGRIGVEGILLAIGIAFFPIYVFPSGNVQPAHAILALFAVVVLVREGMPYTAWTVLMGAMLMHVLVVETFYVGFTHQEPQFKPIAFWLYNLLFAASLYVYALKRDLHPVKIGLLCAAVLALTTVLASGVQLERAAPVERAVATFNNPNQLGYFSVCLLSLTYLLSREGKIGLIFTIGLNGVSIFLSIVSLSKAAMLANFAVIAFVAKPDRGVSNILGWATAVALLAAVMMWSLNAGKFDGLRFFHHLTTMGEENDSSLAARGYFVFLEGNLAQFVFGIGKQNVREMHGNEVHSTLASALANYGVFGFLLFSGVILIWSRAVLRAYGVAGVLCLISPAMLYGITHNGSRFTMFWLLVGLSLAMAARRNAEASARAQSSDGDDVIAGDQSRCRQPAKSQLWTSTT